MRISDWSSDVCSSDLVGRTVLAMAAAAQSGDAGESLRQAAVHGWSDVGALLDQQLLGSPSSGLDVTAGGLIAAVLAIALTWLVSVLVRRALHRFGGREGVRSEEHTSELKSLMRI